MNAQLDALSDGYSYARFRAKHENKTVYLYRFEPDASLPLTHPFRYSVRDTPPAAPCWTLIASVSPSGVVTPCGPILPDPATGGAARLTD